MSQKMQQDFSYPVALTPDEEDDGFVVTFPDIPEAITQGEDRIDALAQAADALEEAIAGRIRQKDEIPVPSRPRKGQPIVSVLARSAPLVETSADPDSTRSSRSTDRSSAVG